MDRKELKSKIPHGYNKVIAERAGVSQQTVSAFLKGKNNNVSVEMTALEVLAELVEKKNGFLSRLEKGSIYEN